MKIKISHLLFVLIVIILIYIAAVIFDLYTGKVSIDKPHHILGGIFFTILGLFLFQKHLVNTSATFRNLTLFNFALTGSFIWELYELFLYTYFRNQALMTKMYSPTVNDAMLDIFFGVLGSFIVMWFYMRNLGKS